MHHQVVEVLTSNDVGPTDRYKRKKKCYKDTGYVDSSKAFYVSILCNNIYIYNELLIIHGLLVHQTKYIFKVYVCNLPF